MNFEISYTTTVSGIVFAETKKNRRGRVNICRTDVEFCSEFFSDC